MRNTLLTAAAPMIVMLTTSLLVCGCSDADKNQEWLSKAGKDMDDVAKGIEEYGTISMSSPLLTSPSDVFTFDLKRDPNLYFKEAKEEIQGASALFTQEALDTQLGISARVNIAELLRDLSQLKAYRGDLVAFDRKRSLKDLGTTLGAIVPLLNLLAGNPSLPTDPNAATDPNDGADPNAIAGIVSELTGASVADVLAKAAAIMGEGLEGGDSRPTFPNLAIGSSTPAIPNDPNAPGAVLPATRPAKEVLTTWQFTKFMELLTDGKKAAMSNRAALITAAGDKATEAILRFISNPVDAAKFKDKVVLFGVAMVSVNPGHRTYRGFAADIAVSVSFDYQPARTSLIEMLRGKGDSTIQEMIQEVELLDAGRGVAGSGEAETPKETKVDKDVPPAEKDKKHGSEWGQPDIAKRARRKGASEVSMPPTHVGRSRSLRDIPGHWQVSEGNTTALVAAVSPMTETQALDLQSSFRKQKAFAIQLAAALSGMGLNIQGKLLSDWVKRVEQDVATRSAFNAVTAYSNSGGIFGFQIAPRLKALGDPSSHKAKPSMILDPLTFPVLIILGIDHDDLLKVRVDGNYHASLVEPVLKFRQTTRWIPQGNPTRDHWFFGRGWDRLGKRRLSEKERMCWARKLYTAKRRIRERPRHWSSDEIELLSSAGETLDHVISDRFTDPNARPTTRDALDLQNTAIKLLEPGKLKKKSGCWAKKLRDKPRKESVDLAERLRDIATKEKLSDPNLANLMTIRQKLSNRIAKIEAAHEGEEVLAEFASNRIDVLDYAALDSWSYQSLPESVFVRDPWMPHVSDVVANKIVGDGKTASKVLLRGENLDRLSDDLKEYKVDVGKVKITGVKHVGSDGLLLTFTPDKVSGSPAGVVFKLPFLDIKGKIAYVRSPVVKVNPAPVVKPSVSNVIPHGDPNSGTWTIVVIGQHLDQIEHDSKTGAIPGIVVPAGLGTVTGARLAKGYISFDFKPKSPKRTCYVVFGLPNKPPTKATTTTKPKKKYTSTPMVVLTPLTKPQPKPTTQYIKRKSTNMDGKSDREEVEYSQDADTDALRTIIINGK